MENFIGEYKLKNQDTCDQLITLYQNSDQKFAGKVGIILNLLFLI